MNLLDKTKSYFSSEAELEITRNRELSKMISTQGNTYDISTPTPNYDIGYETTNDDDLEDLETARNTARLKVKNNGFAKGILKAATDHVVGNGLNARSTINRRRMKNLSEDQIKNIENDLNDYWDDWVDSQNSDVTGLNNFLLQQRLAYYVYKRDGENFASLPIINNEISLKLIGAEFIEGDNEGFSFGIKTNKNKLPIAYRVLTSSETNKYQTISNNNIKKNMLHTFNRERIDMLRGFPFLSEIARDVDYIDDYMKTELKAAKVAALFVGSIETAATQDVFKKPNSDLSGMSSSNPTINENDKVFHDSQITQLQKGETLNIHSQSRDNPNFDKLVNTSLQKVAACTRLPIEIILTIFTSSYSASRASMLMMQKFIGPERLLLNTTFNNPIRNQVIEWGVLTGRLDIPNFFQNKKEYLRCEWVGDAMGSVDPVKDVNAKVTAIDNNLTTRTKATRDLGNGDFETNIKQLEKENKMLDEANLSIKEEDEEDINN